MSDWFVRFPCVLIAAACVSACAPPPAARPAPFPALDDEVSRQLAANDALPWTESRRLGWNDFRGTAPTTGPEGALTAYSLFYGVRCAGTHFQYRVVAAFLPDGSWVKPEVLKDPARNAATLQHEQTHFDLSEVYARRMRRQFSGVYDPCGVPKEQLDAAAERVIADEKAAQSRYDDETRHGLTASRQTQWDADVRQMLVALERFGASTAASPPGSTSPGPISRR